MLISGFQVIFIKGHNISLWSYLLTVGSHYSHIATVTCGVPLGSVLGPLMFLIYINDICKAVPDTKVKLYVDDTDLFLFDTDANNLNINAKVWKRSCSIAHTAANNTWYNDHVMRPRSYSRGLRNIKKIYFNVNVNVKVKGIEYMVGD